MSAAERTSEARSAERANEWAVRAKERAKERMVRNSRLQFHSHFTRHALVLEHWNARAHTNMPSLTRAYTNQDRLMRVRTNLQNVYGGSDMWLPTRLPWIPNAGIHHECHLHHYEAISLIPTETRIICQALRRKSKDSLKRWNVSVWLQFSIALYMAEAPYKPEMMNLCGFFSSWPIRLESKATRTLTI